MTNAIVCERSWYANVLHVVKTDDVLIGWFTTFTKRKSNDDYIRHSASFTHFRHGVGCNLIKIQIRLFLKDER